jgi:predicted nuclease of predicted toxin-antitoxin system
MKFLVDEDLPRSTAQLVQSYGHDVEDVRDVGLRGQPDTKIVFTHNRKADAQSPLIMAFAISFIILPVITPDLLY